MKTDRRFFKELRFRRVRASGRQDLLSGLIAGKTVAPVARVGLMGCFSAMSQRVETPLRWRGYRWRRICRAMTIS